MQVVERYLGLLFGAIVAGIILTNPRGVEAILKGFATFSAQTVEAFTGGRGFVGR